MPRKFGASPYFTTRKDEAFEDVREQLDRDHQTWMERPRVRPADGGVVLLTLRMGNHYTFTAGTIVKKGRRDQSHRHAG